MQLIFSTTTRDCGSVILWDNPTGSFTGLRLVKNRSDVEGPDSLEGRTDLIVLKTGRSQIKVVSSV